MSSATPDRTVPARLPAWPASALPRAMAVDREQTSGEEIANAISHGAGFLLAVASLPILLQYASRLAGPADVVGATLFAATMMLLYLVSMLYHALPAGRAKHWFNRLDHAAIYVFIAGSYMPYLLGVLRGAWGWTLFGVVWGLAVLGVTLKSAGGIRYPRLSTALYVGMGWLALIAIRPLWLYVPLAGWMWLIAGGFAYTAGIAFYAAEKLRYGHLVWHLFVLMGTTCHFFAVLWYAA